LLESCEDPPVHDASDQRGKPQDAPRDNVPSRSPYDTGSAAFLDAWNVEGVRQRRTATRRSTLRVARETVQVLLFAVLLLAGTRTVVQGREVRGPSMQPAYHTGQRLFVTRYFFHGPSHEDVVVFHPPAPSQDDYIKRVIGVPGDRVQVKNGRVTVNGVTLDESYLTPGQQTTCSGRWCDVTLGEDEYFVMGDNRPNSSDSRVWGPVQREKIVGKAWLLYYPFTDFGLAP